ncbi:hypothetical protein FRC08_011687 [Ceratobasidium sp. 394]|nr:hypothetical protein FRC08_011687 [Ceratobasidium sp. 394]
MPLSSITVKSPNVDGETFSTPPSTPSAFSLASSSSLAATPGMNSDGTPTPSTNGSTRPSTSRRPSSLLLPHDSNAGWVDDVELVREGTDHTPRHTPDYRGQHALLPDVKQTTLPAVLSPLTKFHASQAATPKVPAAGVSHALKSPCFVHSLLDKGASLSDWLHNTQARPATHMQPSPPSTNMSGSSSEPDFDEDDDEYGGNLTRQLAETAVGVREMSKQLGRARVRSKINNVLIITKARDNRLIKLTRELALMLMNKERDDGRGHVV